MREFTHWLTQTFLKENSSKEFLIENSFDSISCSSGKDNRIENRDSFIRSNFTAIVENLRKIENRSSGTFISNGYITYSELDLQKYVEPDYRRDKYPVFSVIINRNDNSNGYQNSFDFLRTESGYKLISVLLRGKDEIRFSQESEISE